MVHDLHPASGNVFAPIRRARGVPLAKAAGVAGLTVAGSGLALVTPAAPGSKGGSSGCAAPAPAALRLLLLPALEPLPPAFLQACPTIGHLLGLSPVDASKGQASPDPCSSHR